MKNYCEALCFKEKAKSALLNNLKRHYFDEYAIGDRCAEYGVDTRVWSKTSVEILLNPSFEDGLFEIEIDSELAQLIITELCDEGYLRVNDSKESGYITFLGVPKTDPFAKYMTYRKVININHRL